MRRAAALGLCLLSLAGCGDDSLSGDDLARQAQERNREQRIRRLERELKEKRADTPAPQRLPRYEGQVGVTYGPPGRGKVTRMGDLAGGSAWSTMKVPIALGVLDRGASPRQRSEVERALTASDNAAADRLFESLGGAGATTDVLRQAGDATTQVSSVGRYGFSPYGQTDWTLEAQHRFMAALAAGCVGKPASRKTVLDAMGRVRSDRWGLGSAGAPARWKGGWGPGTDGKYLVRQMGIVETGRGPMVVTLAAVPSDGTFESGQALATELAQWLVANGRGGRPGGC